MPNYHIRIESDEDGVVGEWDLPGFVFAFNPPNEDDTALRWVSRHIDDPELIGMLEIIKASLINATVNGIEDAGPLLDK